MLLLTLACFVIRKGVFQNHKWELDICIVPQFLRNALFQSLDLEMANWVSWIGNSLFRDDCCHLWASWKSSLMVLPMSSKLPVARGFLIPHIFRDLKHSSSPKLTYIPDQCTDLKLTFKTTLCLCCSKYL